MALRLSLENLQVETFPTAGEPSMGLASTGNSLNPTYDPCCASGLGPRCTLECAEPSNLTNYIACCG